MASRSEYLSIEDAVEYFHSLSDSEGEIDEQCDSDANEDSDKDLDFVPDTEDSEIDDEIEIEDEQPDYAIPTDIDDAYDVINFENLGQYVAKSGRVWSSKPFPQTRRLQRNILNLTPGVTSYMSSATEIIDIFNNLITPTMKEIMANHTNKEAQRVFEKYNEKFPDKQRKWNAVTVTELDAFFGVLLSAGALHCRRENLKEMWTTDESIRRNIFTAAISRNRFVAISRYLRFDDKTTRSTRRQVDKLAAIREIWDTFVDNCRNSFTPFGEVTIDEQLVTFRGKCPFRQYIKSKPGKYGIKIWAASDVKTSYLYNMQVYTGKAQGGIAEKNQGARVVKDLAEPLFGSGTGITTDNFFTSFDLAEFLLSKNLTLLGTVRKNKTDTPNELKVYKTRQEHSSIFAFTKSISMVSYTSKRPDDTSSVFATRRCFNLK